MTATCNGPGPGANAHPNEKTLNTQLKGLVKVLCRSQTGAAQYEHYDWVVHKCSPKLRGRMHTTLQQVNTHQYLHSDLPDMQVSKPCRT